MIVRTRKWQDFIKQILIHGTSGYIEYVHIEIPEEKAHRVEHVVNRLIKTYPEVEYDKNKRYKRAKRGLVNMALIIFDRQMVVMRTKGEWIPRENEDKFSSLKHGPFITVGKRVKIRIGKGKAGKPFTAFLDRSSYRWIRDTIVSCIRSGQVKAAYALWDRVQDLPAFQGIAEQIHAMHSYLNEECRKQRKEAVLAVPTLPKPKLRKAY